MRGKANALLPAGVLGGMLVANLAAGQDLDDIISAEQERIRQAQQAQEQIDQIAEETRNAFDEYQVLLREIDGLEVYNELMQARVTAQERQLADLRQSIDTVTLVERQVVPLMTRMIDSLEKFISLDVPFRLEERMGRVEELRDLLQRADVSAASQFRNVWQAWQIENDYGRFPETYKGELEIDGVVREVDFLMVGRVGLYYVTPDNAVAGAWDKRNREWVQLTRSDAQEIRKGIRMLDTGSPELFMIPIAPPQEN